MDSSSTSGTSSVTVTSSSTAMNQSFSSYEIVQSQLRDLVLYQQSACDRLIEDSVRQSTVNDNTISREEFQKVLKELEEERLQHARTKARLMEVEDKLDFSLGEIEILQRQLQREKAQFEKAFDILKEKTQKETRERTELVSQCSVLSKTAHEQKSTLSEKENQLREMNRKLKVQKEHYEKQVVEMSLEKQQEMYANKVLKEMESKKSKTAILKPRN